MRRGDNRSTLGSMAPRRRAFHSSSRRSRAQDEKEDDKENDDDNPWGDLDKAFENLQDKSLYKQVYLNHPTDSVSPASESSPKEKKDPIAEMEEAIFAQAGAAAVKSTPSPKNRQRKVTMTPIADVKFSDVPPSASSVAMGGGSDFSMMGNMGAMGSMGSAGANARWSEYMQNESNQMEEEEDDSPWSSLDAFVDNPESSAQFAVPLHLQGQQQIWQRSAQRFAPPHDADQHQNQNQHQQDIAAREALAANTDFIRAQGQLPNNLSEEEALFAQAGAAAVSELSDRSVFPTSTSTAPSLHSSSSAGVATTQSGTEMNVDEEEDSDQLSHVNPVTGGASMVDVSSKVSTSRSATAVGRVYLPTMAAELVRSTEASRTGGSGGSGGGVSGKGPVLHTAQLAGILAAKKTADLIPLCHPLPLTHVDVQLSLHSHHHGQGDSSVSGCGSGEEEEGSWIHIECTARTTGQTGVEMEALTGATVAALTVWDMVKAVAGKSMRMGHFMVVKKSGGKSGDWQRSA